MLRRYILAITFGNLVWEVAQLPLYTIWYEGSPDEVDFAAVHCTGGDLSIASSALLGALVIAGNRHWPHAGFGTGGTIAVLGGLAHTVFSEWLNTEIRLHRIDANAAADRHRPRPPRTVAAGATARALVGPSRHAPETLPSERYGSDLIGLAIIGTGSGSDVIGPSQTSHKVATMGV